MIVVALLVTAAVAVLALSLGRRVATYEPGSPEGIVQEYLTSALDGDFDRAASLLDPAGDCDASDLDRAFIQESARISLIEAATEGDRARVRVSVEIPSGGPLGGYFGEEHTIRLARTDTAWVITGIPWPLYDCNPPKG